MVPFFKIKNIHIKICFMDEGVISYKQKSGLSDYTRTFIF